MCICLCIHVYSMLLAISNIIFFQHIQHYSSIALFRSLWWLHCHELFLNKWVRDRDDDSVFKRTLNECGIFWSERTHFLRHRLDNRHSYAIRSLGICVMILFLFIWNCFSCNESKRKRIQLPHSFSTCLKKLRNKTNGGKRTLELEQKNMILNEPITLWQWLWCSLKKWIFTKFLIRWKLLCSLFIFDSGGGVGGHDSQN